MTKTADIQSLPEPVKGYNDLKYYFSNLNTLFSIRSTLAVDMMTAMPSRGMDARLSAISSMTKRIYAETITTSVRSLLEQVEEAAHANPSSWEDWDLANLREMRRIYDHLAALPPDIYLASVQIANMGRKRHAATLKNPDWTEVEPHMQQVVDLYRKIAELKHKRFQSTTLYKALFLGYASDCNDLPMSQVFDSLLPKLNTLHKKALERQENIEAPIALNGHFDRKGQMELNRLVLEKMGFDFEKGSLLISSMSPMAAGTPDDIRVLVRCVEGRNFMESLEDTLYQGARGLYIQNLPDHWKNQPVGSSPNSLMMGATSILYENILGRTPQFMAFISEHAQGLFKSVARQSLAAENLYQLKKVIRNTARRDDADELTKILHDILRYRIEKDLINGKMNVNDIPERWNEESRGLLGLTPKGLTDGPLQNPDWFTGRFGFISTNVLSHMIACSLQNKLFADIKKLPDHIRICNLAPVKNWMAENIFSKGRHTPALSMVQDITGAPLTENDLLAHFERRYLGN